MPLITKSRVNTVLAFLALFALGFVEDFKNYWREGRL